MIRPTKEVIPKTLTLASLGLHPHPPSRHIIPLDRVFWVFTGSCVVFPTQSTKSSQMIILRFVSFFIQKMLSKNWLNK